MAKPQDVLATIFKFLKPKGILLISTPLAEKVIRFDSPLDWSPHHITRFTLAEVEKLLSQTGSSEIKIDYNLSEDDLLDFMIVAAKLQIFKNQRTADRKRNDAKFFIVCNK